VLTAVTPAQSGRVRIEGRMGQAPWSATLDLATAVEGNGVSKLWARSKIGAIEDLRYHGANEGDVDAEVLKVALAHHLVSRLTSLVAVDVTPSRPRGENLTTSEMPTNLPHGWNFEKVFGEDPAHPSIKASLDESLMTKLAMADAPKGKLGQTGEGVELPQTDAGTDLLLLLSALFTLSGLSLVALLNRKPVRK